MPDIYYSVNKSASIELEEKKSRFIAHCSPLNTEADADSFVESIRARFPDASHNVYAWIIGLDTNRQKYSDDGEPQGTAGMPVLDVLRKNSIIQAGIVVTRYFGGTQLGAGGLVRAYTASAAEVLKSAGICKYQLCREYELTVSYAHLEKLRYRLANEDIVERNCDYGVDAVMKVALPVSGSEKIYDICADITAGAAIVEPDELVYLPLPLPDPPDIIQAGQI